MLDCGEDIERAIGLLPWNVEIRYQGTRVVNEFLGRGF